MRGCSTNEAKKGEIGKMILRRRFDVCALRETKLKGKEEVMSGVVVGRARKGVALLLSGRFMRYVVEWKEVSSWLMWVRVKIESWVFISAYLPGSEKSEEEIEEFWNELRECVGSFGRNESVACAWGFECQSEKRSDLGDSWTAWSARKK